MLAACIGVGTVGRSWAIVFARAGWRVALWDIERQKAEAAQEMIFAALRALEAGGDITESAQTVAARIFIADSLEAAVAGAEWVQESAAENLDVKRNLFLQLDTAAGDEALLASSTSAIPGSLFMNDLAGVARCLIAHPVNPPHLIPLVELCGSPYTATETLDSAHQIMSAFGQDPVRLNREIDGFLLNRLQWALMSEALHLVGEGVCSARDLDRVMTSGLARRWAFLGPLSVAHLNASAGIEGYFDVLGEAFARVQKSLRTDYPLSRQLVDKLNAALSADAPLDEIENAQRARDLRIAALRRYLDGVMG